MRSCWGWVPDPDRSSAEPPLGSDPEPLRPVAGRAPEALRQRTPEGGDFSLVGPEIARRVLLPAILPRLLVGLRLSLGIAWLVVVDESLHLELEQRSRTQQAMPGGALDRPALR